MKQTVSNAKCAPPYLHHTQFLYILVCYSFKDLPFPLLINFGVSSMLLRSVSAFALVAVFTLIPSGLKVTGAFTPTIMVSKRQYNKIGATNALFTGTEKMFMSQAPEEESRTTPVADLGFDEPRERENISRDQLTPGTVSNDRLRQSLDDSANFKIKNDARFTWLSTFLVSSCYAYGCLGGTDGSELLATLGVPDGGIAGGLGAVFFAIVSMVLFFAPELFGKKNVPR